MTVPVRIFLYIDECATVMGQSGPPHDMVAHQASNFKGLGRSRTVLVGGRRGSGEPSRLQPHLFRGYIRRVLGH